MSKKPSVDVNDFIGYKKGCIEVIGLGQKDEHGHTLFKVVCNTCGSIQYLKYGSIIRLKGLWCSNCKKKYNRKTQGESETRLYGVWKGMVARCTNNKHRSYKSYGGRGIKVCKEWLENYTAFRDWAISNNYNEDNILKSGKNSITIDRIDVNGDYCPENCRFVTNDIQYYNKRNTLQILYNGEMYTLKTLADMSGLSISTLKHRVQRGWSEDRLLESCNKNSYKYEYNGNNYSLSELSKISGIPRSTLYRRIMEKGWDIKKSVETPTEK